MTWQVGELKLSSRKL